MEITLKSKPIRAQVLWKYREEDKVFIIFKPNSFSLNDTGSFIWENANGDLSVLEIAEKLAQKFENADIDTVEKETLLFVETLIKANLLYIDEFEEENYD